jgi:hypothetical protein
MQPAFRQDAARLRRHAQPERADRRQHGEGREVAHGRASLLLRKLNVEDLIDNGYLTGIYLFDGEKLTDAKGEGKLTTGCLSCQHAGRFWPSRFPNETDEQKENRPKQKTHPTEQLNVGTKPSSIYGIVNELEGIEKKHERDEAAHPPEIF